MNTNNLKLKTFGGRIPYESYERIMQITDERGVQQSDILREMVEQYLQPTTIEVKDDEWTINLKKCNQRTVGAFLEMMDKVDGGITKEQVLDRFVAFIETRSGDIEEKYLELATKI